MAREYLKQGNERYINDTELLYEIILCKGLGKITLKLEKMLIKLSYNILRKFYFHRLEDKQDVHQEGFYMLYTNILKFDTDKYKKSIPYCTELYKRGCARGFNALYNPELRTMSFDKIYNI